MRIVRMLKPGQKGAKELLTRFGPSLPGVRYRYDEGRREQRKTVEWVVQRRVRELEAERPAGRSRGSRVNERAGSASRWRLALRVGWRERDLQRRVKSAGGRWDPPRRVWMLKRDAAERLDLLARVVAGHGGG